MNCAPPAFTRCVRREACVQIVDAPSRTRGRRTAARCVWTSGSIGCGGEERPLGPLDRDVDQREVGDRLRLAVLEDLEVVLLQVADELRRCDR